MAEQGGENGSGKEDGYWNARNKEKRGRSTYVTQLVAK